MRPQRALEIAIARKTIDVLLAMGYKISVNDGEEVTVNRSRDRDKILAAMFTTDEDALLVHLSGDAKNDGPFGWVRFIYGNDGWDVINDYTTNLEQVLKPVNELADRLERGEYELEVKL